MKTGTLRFSVVLFTTAFLVSFWAQARVEAVIGDVAVAQNPNLFSSLPDTDNSEIIISRSEYVISWNKNRRAPNWVSWRLVSEDIGSSGRSNNFAQDPDLQALLSQSGQSAVLPTDYQGSCFDRGHQAPSGDRTRSAQENQMTFLMSNMIPQTPYLNRVIWEHLEQHTRELVQKEGKQVYVIAGPIYDLDFGAIGPRRDIPVPSKDFKIVVILEAGQTPADINASTPMIAVVMPNTLKGGQAPVAYSPQCGGSAAEVISFDVNDWQNYLASKEQIESLSGLQFHF